MIYKNQISILIQSTWKKELENSTCSIIFVSTNPNTHNAEYWSRRYGKSQQSRVLEAGMFHTQHVLEWGTFANVFSIHPHSETTSPSPLQRQWSTTLWPGANNGAHKAPSWVLPACPRGTLRTHHSRIAVVYSQMSARVSPGIMRPHQVYQSYSVPFLHINHCS